MGRFRFRFNSRYGEEQEDESTMRIEGIPERFWIVTKPTPESELGDCCFDVDFKQFALQIRGGLEVDEIVGIFASEESAKATATKLLAGRDAKPPVSDTVVFASPWPEWFATQEDYRSVSMCKKGSIDKVKVEPPAVWGQRWTWNLTEDGTGIVMRRTV